MDNSHDEKEPDYHTFDEVPRSQGLVKVNVTNNSIHWVCG